MIGATETVSIPQVIKSLSLYLKLLSSEAWFQTCFLPASPAPHLPSPSSPLFSVPSKIPRQSPPFLALPSLPLLAWHVSCCDLQQFPSGEGCGFLKGATGVNTRPPSMHKQAELYCSIAHYLPFLQKDYMSEEALWGQAQSTHHFSPTGESFKMMPARKSDGLI